MLHTGGCSDNVEFGFNLAKAFLDRKEVGHDPRAIINLHNNLVGRMVRSSARSFSPSFTPEYSVCATHLLHDIRSMNPLTMAHTMVVKSITKRTQSDSLPFASGIAMQKSLPLLFHC